jgi:glutaredoxin
MADNKTAILFRMILPGHICPFGVAAKQMLQDAGYDIDDRLLRTRDAVDAFKLEHHVETTPQVFIGGKHIGCSEALDQFLAPAES